MHHIQQALRRRLSPSILVFGTALIATMFALTSTASAALPGYDRFAELSDSNSRDKGATARCPAGLNVVGAGAEISNGAGEVVIEDIIPDSSLKTVAVNAREKQGGTNRNWRVMAIAMCAKPLPGLQLVSEDSDSTSANKSITADCPTGMNVLGTGAELVTSGGSGQVRLDQVNPSTNNVFAFAKEDRDGLAGNWSVTAHAICALPVNQKIVRKSAAPSSSALSIGVQALCTNGLRAIGAGFDSTVLSSQLGDAVIEIAELNKSGVIAATRPEVSGQQPLRTVQAVAICA